MRNRGLRHFVLVVFLLGLAGSIGYAADIPYLQGRVTADAEILSPAAIKRLSVLLEDHEARTTDQVARAVMPSFSPSAYLQLKSCASMWRRF